jgi:excisionase family DNA binding protein
MATNGDSLPCLLTVDEVCDLLHYSRSSVYRNIRGGDLPALRLGQDGKSLRVRADVLETWLEPTAPKGDGR